MRIFRNFAKSVIIAHRLIMPQNGDQNRKSLFSFLTLRKNPKYIAFLNS